MTNNDLTTQFKQIYITQPKCEILDWNCQNMIKRVGWFNWKDVGQWTNHIQVVMTYNDLATQLKQIYITQPKHEIFNWNFQNMIQSDLIKKTNHYFVQPYPSGHDLQWSSRPIKTNIYNSAKTWDIELKLSECNQTGHLIKETHYLLV